MGCSCIFIIGVETNNNGNAVEQNTREDLIHETRIWTQNFSEYQNGIIKMQSKHKWGNSQLYLYVEQRGGNESAGGGKVDVGAEVLIMSQSVFERVITFLLQSEPWQYGEQLIDN